jgi:hypothetical protein
MPNPIQSPQSRQLTQSQSTNQVNGAKLVLKQKPAVNLLQSKGLVKLSSVQKTQTKSSGLL